MPTSVPVQPTITEAGLAAIFNAQSTGVEFALTHIAFGTAQYNPDGTETALQAEKVRVTIAGGGRISPTQIQIYAIAQAVAGSPFFVGEVGFFGDDGTTLLAVYSSTATPNLFLSDTVSTSVSYALGLAALPASSVTVTIDPSASAALLIIGEHVAEADPHPQYVEKVNGVAFYDPTLAFNQGAQIIGDDLLVYQSAQADNIGNLPSTSPTWWVPLYNYGDTPVTGLTNASVTLSSTQAARAHITLSGALTAPLNIVFPNWVKDWTVVNNTTGAFALTCKTAAGTGVVIPQNGSPTRIRGDGTNITQLAENVAAATSPQHPVQLAQLENTGSPLALATAVATLPSQAAQMSQAGFQNHAVYINSGGSQFVSVNGGAFTSVGATTFAAPISGRARVRVWGAGGGSGGTFSASSASQGGGGGAYAEIVLTGLTTAAAITVGLGGSAGTGSSTPSAGGTGGTSSFAGLVSCTGGSGGIGASGGIAGGVAAGGVPSTPNNGGFLVPGGTSWAPYLTAGSGGVSVVSTGGTSFGTPSAHSGASNISANGIPGLFPGGGASGSINQAGGAVGANGCVIVEW